MTGPSSDAEKLRVAIIEAIQDKKGHAITCLDLSGIAEAVTDFFVICHGNSHTQVSAIADNVVKQIKSHLGERPTYQEGMQAQEWVLLDYIDVVVHIFHREKRTFYQLEELWSDAKDVMVPQEDEVNRKTGS